MLKLCLCKDANPISFDALNKLVGQFFYVFEKSQNLYIQREICKNVFAEFPLYGKTSYMQPLRVVVFNYAIPAILDINCADTEHIKRIRDRISSMLSGELYKTSAKKRTLVLNALKTFDANVAKKKKQ